MEWDRGEERGNFSLISFNDSAFAPTHSLVHGWLMRRERERFITVADL
jgi:hypothetical protein